MEFFQLAVDTNSGKNVAMFDSAVIQENEYYCPDAHKYSLEVPTISPADDCNISANYQFTCSDGSTSLSCMNLTYNGITYPMGCASIPKTTNTSTSVDNSNYS